MELIAQDPADLKNIAAELLCRFPNAKKWLLYGDLGSGKTAFARALCEYLHVAETPASPTFSLVNEYTFADPATGSKCLIRHLDLYRLKTLDEALDIGVEDFLWDENLTLIEWPQLIEPIAPPDLLKIQFEILPDSSRKILILEAYGMENQDY